MARKSRGKTEGYIGQRPDGRWEAKLNLGWVNGRRRRKCFYGKKRADVAAKLNDAITKQAQGVPISIGRLTVAQFMTRWLDTIKPPIIRPRTYQNYKSISALHIEPAIGQIQLSKLDAPTIELAVFAGKLAGAQSRESRQLVRLRHLRRQNEEAAEKYLRRIARKSPEKAQQLRADVAKPAHLSATTTRHVRTVLRRALNLAVKWRLIAYNPATLIDLPDADNPEVQPLAAEDARKLLTAAKSHRAEALFVLAIRLGLRRGELLGLQWSDVRFEDRQLEVVRAIQRVAGQPLASAPLKTKGSRRNIALPEEVLRALRAHRARQAEDRLGQGSAWHDQDLVFPNTVGKPLEPRAVDSIFKRLLKRAGLPETTRFHDLRHTAATLLLESGADMFQVSKLLGHAGIAITADIYSHVTQGMRRGLVEKMDGILESPKSEPASG